ncbi:helix-turn-helix transcriptional regulator [Sphingobacterium sp. HJSM2_6]|uniref:helix-turn-helix transcriptional regulator n=1 Tax=Sphingobacterium sp. HJSM2_6 TaxID=3366264 RepID=UPI003BE1440F
MKKSSPEQILLLLKKRGTLDAGEIAEELSITKEGARQHLLKLLEEGLLEKNCVSSGVGRPCTFYSLSNTAIAKFPDAHATVTVQMIDSIKKLLGENALHLLIKDCEKTSLSEYQKELSFAGCLEERLKAIVKIRTEEGYMAEWYKEDNDYYFIENHCPILSAAKNCSHFCQAEINNFSILFGNQVKIERKEHIISGDKRCMYKLNLI